MYVCKSISAERWGGHTVAEIEEDMLLLIHLNKKQGMPILYGT